jgi:phenylpropionate dioxygenase-like ring-hydroxylating dioxygenase large terminal subunit
MILDGWYVAAWSDELTETPIARTICNNPVVIFRTAEGKAAALIDRCCHRAAPLSLGRVVGGGIECGYHGMVFDCSGKCVAIPAQDAIPASAKVRSFPTVEKNQMVWIWTGEPSLADESTIVDFPYHDDTAHWGFKHIVYKIAANHMLPVDNLMDLTHVFYVHRQTIGAGDPKAHMAANVVTSVKERGVKFVSWMMDSAPPATFVRTTGSTKNIDRWREFEFVAPGNVVQFAGGAEAGKGQQAYDENLMDGGYRLRRFHCFTPETDNTTHYFSSVGNGHRPHDQASIDELFHEIDTTVREDIAMVEAQQKELDRAGEEGLMAIKSDATRIAMRRVVGRMLEQQKG